MKEGLKPLWKHKFLPSAKSWHELPVAENLLDRRFNPACPSETRVSDITYIRTKMGWLYLAVVWVCFRTAMSAGYGAAYKARISSCLANGDAAATQARFAAAFRPWPVCL